MDDRNALLGRCEREILKLVEELDAVAIGKDAALHLVWAADLLALERRGFPQAADI